MNRDRTAYVTGSVVSKDGTVLGYRRLGDGPPVVLVHGSMMSSYNFMKLGTALARDFTVYLPDRRGRGLSGPYGPAFTLQRAAEDVQALMDAAHARRVFALSAGANAVLQWALTAPEECKIALYEPPLPVGGSRLAAWLPRYDSEMHHNRPGAAMVTVAKGTKDSRLLQVLPRPVAVPLMDFAMRAQARQAHTDEVPLIDLIATMHHDAQLVLGAEGLIAASTAVRADVLLLGGGRSPRYLKDALDALHAAIPRSRTTRLRGVGHLAADNGGQPGRVARALRGYFSDPPP
ncbi:alpha/beta fold hydrolase [Streptomyces vilmorinianum]|uniref:alpha/beta fold hydrolase n=1 Tax=Streptomyces vilmorinianum TaxID=3051092 RepID=UPI0010FAD24B|nr:alpha/beta fold hydrolase [Streptomyces vilmorinianum]